MADRFVVFVAKPVEEPTGDMLSQLGQQLKLTPAKLDSLLERLPANVTKPVDENTANAVAQRSQRAGLEATVVPAGEVVPSTPTDAPIESEPVRSQTFDAPEVAAPDAYSPVVQPDDQARPATNVAPEPDLGGSYAPQDESEERAEEPREDHPDPLLAPQPAPETPTEPAPASDPARTGGRSERAGAQGAVERPSAQPEGRTGQGFEGDDEWQEESGRPSAKADEQELFPESSFNQDEPRRSPNTRTLVALVALVLLAILWIIL